MRAILESVLTARNCVGPHPRMQESIDRIIADPRYPTCQVTHLSDALTTFGNLPIEQIDQVYWSHRLGLEQILFYDVSGDSTPGPPWNFNCGNNRDALLTYGKFIRQCVLYRLWLLCQKEMWHEWQDPMSLVEDYFADPTPIFVKGEPTSLTKVLANRSRPISAMTLIDQLVQRILHRWLNGLEITQWSTCPSKPGIGGSDDHNTRFYDSLQQFTGTHVVHSDLSQYDYTLQYHEIMADAVIRIEKYQLPHDSIMARAILNCAHVMCQSPFLNCNGDIICYSVPGVQRTGSYNTASTNSRVRVLIALNCGAQDAMCMGDDAVESYAFETRRDGLTSHIQAEVEAQGHVWKEGDFGVSDDHVGHIEFCGLFFRDSSRGEPTHVAKMLARYFRTPIEHRTDPNTITQFLYECRNAPDLELVRQVLQQAVSSLTGTASNEEWKIQEEWKEAESLSQAHRSRPSQSLF